MKRIAVYDTTLRDGAQGEGISFSAAGKVRVAQRLDEFGVDYIEGGYAGLEPEGHGLLPATSRRRSLQHAKVAAFGSTRRAGHAGRPRTPGTPRPARGRHRRSCTIFGKSWRLHVRDVLRTTDEENLRHDRATPCATSRSTAGR